MLKYLLVAPVLFLAAALGQQNQTATMLSLTNAALRIAAGERNAELRMTLDPSRSGGDLLDLALSDPRVRVSVILPGGKELDKDKAGSLGFQWEAVPAESRLPLPFLPGVAHYLLVFPAGQPSGTYLLRADGSDAAQDSVLIATFFPLPTRDDDASGTVAAGLTTDKSIYFAGDPVELTAVVQEGRRPVTRYTVTGTVALSSKDYLPIDPHPVMFSPDPGKLGPGLMSARVHPEATGEYRVAIRITGVDSQNRPFSRVASATFRVYPLRAKLLGISDRAIRSSPGARITRLEIIAQLEVYVAGTYKLSFQLRSPDGKGITPAAKAELETGMQQIIVPVDARLINQEFDQDGPYSIVGPRVRFESADPENGLAALSDAPISTQPYRLNELDLGKYFVDRQSRAIGTEPSSAGKFRALRIELTATTPGGHCSWWGSLSDQKHGELGFSTENTGERAPGQSTFALDFNGAKIAQRGLDGPLIVWGFSVDCEGIRVQDTHEHRTQAFRA